MKTKPSKAAMDAAEGIKSYLDATFCGVLNGCQCEHIKIEAAAIIDKHFEWAARDAKRLDWFDANVAWKFAGHPLINRWATCPPNIRAAIDAALARAGKEGE